MVAAGGLGACGRDSEICIWGFVCPQALYGQIEARTGRAPDCWQGCMQLTAIRMIANF
eukprot:COSAG01_NODE_63702_length_279_cov_0.572222_1_plen_57_part_01